MHARTINGGQTMNDTIVNSVRRIRESIFKTYDYNLKKLYEHERKSYTKIIHDKKMSRTALKKA